MLKLEILKDIEFEEVTQARVDSKRRIALGKSIPSEVTGFKVYRNAHGQVILDPMVSIPAHETWLFKSKPAVQMVHQGLEDAKQGRLVKPKRSFSRYAKR